MVRFQGAVALLLVLTVSGCGAGRNKHIRRQASVDLSCSEGQVHVSTVSKSSAQFLAQACGRRAVYTYEKHTGAVRISAIEGANVAPALAPPPPGGAYGGPPPPPPPPPPAP